MPNLNRIYLTLGLTFASAPFVRAMLNTNPLSETNYILISILAVLLMGLWEITKGDKK